MSQGIEIAKINTKISIIDFEIAVAGLLRDVETAYWQLYLAHESLIGVKAFADKVEVIAENVATRIESNAVGASVIEETEVEQAQIQLELQAHEQANAILRADAQLRRLLRLSIERETVFRPVDSLFDAEFVFDWTDLVTTAHGARPELRRQRLRLSQFRKQVTAAKSLAKPRLDFVSQYQVNGFGDRLFAEDGPTDLESGYGRLFQGDETGWTAGVQFSTTMGRRLGRTRVQNLQLQVAKAAGVLNEQMAEINAELADAVREIDKSRKEIELNERRVRSAERNRNASASRFETVGDSVSLLTWLRAEQSLLNSRGQDLASRIGYNTALVNLRHRTGTILHLNDMSICGGTSEVIWHTKASIRSRMIPLDSFPEEAPQPPMPIQLPIDRS